MPISYHVAGGLQSMLQHPDETEAEAYRDKFNLISDACSQLEGSLYVTSIIYSGACDRFPEFKFVLGESGITWVPFLVERMDAHYLDGRHQIALSMKPSDYWRRQGHSTFQTDGILADMLDLVGENNAIWGSDYPHPDGVWPDSQEIIASDFGRMTEEKRRKVICENAGRLYGFLP
jgi:predicted TIM-barrel fold metal-dependent hydrolase